MGLYAQATRDIDTATPGPKIGAFFDLDQTLLAGFSALAFFRERLLSGRMAPRDLVESVAGAVAFGLGRTGFSGLMSASTAGWRGVSESVLERLGEEVFEKQLAAAVYPESRALVGAHRARGHTLAIVSSATRYQIDPLARDLRIEHVLCTRLEVENGVFTGRVEHPTCYGEGKAVAAGRLAGEVGLDLARSFFYTDSHEDLPLLEAVGNPRPVNPSRRLATLAAERGWPVRRFHSRGTPGVGDVLRTGLLLGSLVPSVLTGLPAGLLNRSRRQAANLALTTWGELGTALAGVDLRVEGEAHLWSQRPAVFVFNHQSGIDALLVCKLLRRDFVGVAKKELERHPLFGPFFQFAGTVFIDRADPTRAIEGLEPAVEALRQGLSLVIAPEGTRSSTPRPGRFKKGAFHIAMRAGVPVVPVVFRNALDALPKHGVVVRPATVEVVVLPPIPTAGWTRDSLDDEIEAVRRLFVETLEGAPAAPEGA